MLTHILPKSSRARWLVPWMLCSGCLADLDQLLESPSRRATIDGCARKRDPFLETAGPAGGYQSGARIEEYHISARPFFGSIKQPMNRDNIFGNCAAEECIPWCPLQA
jgi:hypothetical protein